MNTITRPHRRPVSRLSTLRRAAGRTPIDALEPRRLFAAGLPDLTFNLTGNQTTGFGNQFDAASAVVRQSDGKLVVAGYTSSNTTGLSNFALARYNTDGSLDFTFGTQGRVTTGFGAGTSAQAVGLGITTDDRILVGGFVVSGTGANANSNFALASYGLDGQPSTNFGTGGLVVADLGSNAESVSAFSLDTANNRVYLGGTNGGANSALLLARFDASTGALDTTFNTTGIATATVPGGASSISALALAPGNTIVAAGYRDTPVTGGSGGVQADSVLARFTAAGALDNTFNSASATPGLLVVDASGTSAPDELLGLAVASDGSVVAAGFAGNTLPRLGESRFLVLKATPAGVLDATFANAGRFVATSSVPQYQALSSVALLSDNRVVAVGTLGDPNAPAASPDAINARFAALRLSANGALDTTFGTSGIAQVELTAGFDDAKDVIVLPDGRLAVAGVAGNTSQNGGGADFGLALLSADTGLSASAFDAPPVAQGQNAVFTVTLSQPATTTTTLDYTTSDGPGTNAATGGTDFTSTSGTLTFAPGESTKTIAVPTLVSAANTAGRSFTLTLSLPSGSAATLARAVATATVLGTGQALPAPIVRIDNITVAEPLDGTATSTGTFTVSLDRATDQPVTLTYATANGSAGTSDYTPTSGTVTIAAGSTTATINISVLRDTVVEGNESFVLNLTNATNATLGANNQGVATITDAPAPGAPTVSVSGPTAPVAERLSGRTLVPITLTLSSASTVPVTVNYATADGTATAGQDYLATVGTITIPAGSTTATVNVPVLGDVNVETGTEAFTFSLTAASGANLATGGASTATVVIADAAFRTLTFTGTTRVQDRRFTDADGHTVTGQLSGPGSVTLYFPAAAANADADTMIVSGTSARSRVTLTASGRNAATNVNFIRLDAPVNAINARTLNLTGDLIATNAALTTLTLRSVANSLITLGAGTTSTLTLGTVTDTSITSASALRTLSVTSWTDSDANDVVSAPSIATVTSRGNFAARVDATAGDIRSYSVRGALTGGGATATGQLRSVSVGAVTNALFNAGTDIASFTARGAVTNSTVRVGNRLARFSAVALNDSRILAGVGLDSVALPTAPAAFAGLSSSIGTVTLRNRGGASFSNSLILAPTLSTVTLGTVAIGAGTVVQQGVVADTISRASYNPPNGRTITFRNLVASDNTNGNFTLRAV